MKQQCESCGRLVEKIIPIGDALQSAERSARASAHSSSTYTALIGLPYEDHQIYPCIDYVCVRCARKILNISDDDLIREERLLEINKEFLLNTLKGRLAQVVVEAIFQRFGYEVYPYGYESYLTNIIKFMRKGDANIPARKMRCSPDLFVYDREYNDGYFVEVKATSTPDETNCWISRYTLRQYKLHWAEAILVVYCIPTMNIYCRQIDGIPIEALSVVESPITGYSNYVVNLEADFKKLPDCFRLIDPQGLAEFSESLNKVVSGFSRLASSNV